MVNVKRCVKRKRRQGTVNANKKEVSKNPGKRMFEKGKHLNNSTGVFSQNEFVLLVVANGLFGVGFSNGFLIIYVFRLRKWNHLIPIHSILYFAFAYSAINKLSYA